MINKAILKDVIEKPITGEWGKEGNTVKVLRTTNFTNDGKIKFDNVVTRDIARNKTSDKRLIKGDIIIEKSGGSPTQPVGRVVFFEAEGEFLCNNFTAILRPKKELVFPKFLFYLLFTYHKYGFTGGFQNKTTGIINLQLKSYIDKTKIPLPPLETQKKIAEILDAADNLRQKTKTLIEKYDKLTQSLFLDMFGDPVSNPKKWKTQTLINLAQLKSGGTPTRDRPEYFKGDIPWITTVALGKRKINHEDAVEFITAEAIENSATKLIPKGSIMIGTRVGVGKASMTECDMCSSQDIISLINIDETINKIFMLEIFSYYNEFFKSQKRGATIQGITSNTIKNLKIISPLLYLQNQFAERVQAIEEQKVKAQVSLEKSEELFQSLLQKAFKGEIN